MRQHFLDQILSKIILQNLEVYGFHQTTQEASDILLDVIKAFIINLAVDVSKTLEHSQRTSPSIQDILHSLQSMYSMHPNSLIEFLIYLNMNYKELPRLEFEFFKKQTESLTATHNPGISLQNLPQQQDEEAANKEGTTTGTLSTTTASNRSSHPPYEYDYSEIEFTNKRRSKLIPILQQQQSDVLPFYLPSYPRAANITSTDEEKKKKKKEAEQESETQQDTPLSADASKRQKEEAHMEDLNLLEIQQRVIESYRRRGKKRKRKVSANQNGGARINPYLAFASET